MLIQHFLENSADKYPEKNAVWYLNRWATYLEIEQKANSIANFLLSNGTSRGDRIALLMENSINYVICYFGILKSGAVVVPINNEITPTNLLYLLHNSEAVALITNDKFTTLLSVLSDAKSVKILLADIDESPFNNTVIKICSLSSALESGDITKPQTSIISLDLASIVYTSGSTGEPKGVMLSHQNLTENTISISQYLNLASNDRIMVVLPFYYIYGNSLLTTHFYSCGSVIIDNHFIYPNLIIDTMEKMQVTGFAGVPSTYSILLNKSVIKEKKIKSLRYVTQAGGAMTPALQLQVSDTLFPAKLYIMYGTTEAAPRLTYLEPDFLNEKIGSIGKAIPNVEVIIADEYGMPVPSGETGEIAARGSNIMMGYWKDPKSTANVIRNGFYYTGDLGKTDKDGFIYIVGRKKEIIKVGGNRVSPKEIEEALMSLPEINDAAVIGVPDPILGESIKAFIVFKNPTYYDLFEIRKKLSSLVAPYKMPKLFEVKNELPKNEFGKIMKERLKNI